MGSPTADPSGGALKRRDDRLDALKQNVSRLAHDFNNFMVPILGYVTLIREELVAGSTAITYAGSMEDAARKTAGYLENLLFTVRPVRSYHPRTFDLRAALETEVQAWQKEIPESAQICVRSELATALLYGDEDHWRKAFRQVLANARFALATGGVLTVKLEAAAFSPAEVQELRLAAPRGFRLVFSDTGFGMAPNVLEHAFEPFFTTRSGQAGSGLGLTLVHSVALLHGGQVLLESVEDAGTTVTLLIPSRPEPAEQTSDDSPSPSAQRKKGGSKVLLVEDDPMVREVIKTCLQKTGLEVVTASDGEMGLRMFKKHCRDLALVVSDVTMPKMNGIELFLAIRQLDPQAQIVLVSGDAEGTREESLSRLGKDRPLLIRKPFTLKAFSQIIHRYLAN